MIDLGGYYHFKNHPGEQFLFCYGHSIAGQTENYAYVGMYWTWGKDERKEKDSDSGGLFPGPRIMSDTDTVRRCRGVAQATLA